MPALIFPAPGYTAVDSSSILSTATWCSSDSLGSVGKLKTRSTIVASAIKLDVPKVSLSRKLTTDPVNFTPNVIKRGFQAKSVNSSILTTSTNRLESTVNATTFVYTQTSVTTTLAPITARERLYYAQIAPGKYGQILTYNNNKVIDVVSSQLKSSVLSKPITILRPDISSRTSISLLSKPITILRPDNSRIFNTGTSIPLVNRAIFGNKLPRTYTTSSIKTVNIDIQLPITGRSGSTADTVSWYINDQDILTVVSVGTPLVTLYFARSIYAPSAGSTVRLINSNIGYSKQISVISATDGSITFTDPGDLPSISSMYIATVTSQNIIDYVTTVYLDNSTKIFDTPSVAKIKTITSLRPDSKKSIGVENTATTFSRLESTVNTTTFVYTQTSVSTTLAPTTARERLYYAQVAPGKYGQSYPYIASSQGVLTPLSGKISSVTKLIAMTSMVSRATLQKPIVSLRPDSSYPSKIYIGTDTTQVFYDTTIENVIQITTSARSSATNVNNLIDWLDDETDILSTTDITPAVPLLTIYIDRNSIVTPQPVVQITMQQVPEGLSLTTTASVVSYTSNSITVIDPGTVVSPLDTKVQLHWTIARSVITTTLSSNDINKTSLINKAIFGKKIPRAYTTATFKTVTTDIVIPITGSSGSTADTVSWYINDQDILTVLPQGSQLVTLYFARTIYSIANTVTLSSSVTGYNKKVSVISSTDGSITFTNPGDLPSISSLSMVITISKDIIDYSTVAYLDNSTQIFDTPKSSNLPISPIKLRSDNVRSQTVNTVKTVAKLLSTTGIDVRANLQKPIVSLRSDNNQRSSTYNTATQMSVVNKAIFGKRSTRAYTTATVRTVTTDIAIPITGISGSTADTVSWYINDQDILTVIPQGSQLVTLYFARTIYSIGSTVNLLNSVTGYNKKVSVISSTDGSVTFTDPGDLPSISSLSMIITTSRDIIDYSTVAYLDSSTKIFDVPGSYKLSRVTSLKADTSRISTVGKTNTVTRLIGKTTIGTSGNLQKSVVSLKSDNNQRSGVYNTATQISLVNKVTFGSRIPRAYTTSTTQTISVDTVIYVTGRSGSTADIVDWYINDQDILTVIPQGSQLVTLYFAKQPQLYFIPGSSVKLLNYVNGYSKQISVISATDGSITFTDPGDLPSISGLQLIYTEIQTVFRSVTNTILENGIEIFNTPAVSNLSKSLVALRADSTSTKMSGLINKPIVSLRGGPPSIPALGKVKSAIVLRPDGNQRSSLYTTATGTTLINKAIFGKRSTRAITTSTIRTVITDIAIPVTGISISKSTADTVSWYINDQDILTVVPVGSSLVTFFFNSSQLGSNIRITNGTSNYIQSISVISITNSSITFSDPGNLPGIGEMYILSSTTQNITDYQTYSYLDSGTQMFDMPTVSKLSRAISVKSVPAQIQTVGKAKIISKLIPGIAVGTPSNLQKQLTVLKADNNQRTVTSTTATQVPLVNKITFGGRFPRAYTTSTTRVNYVDTPWPITGRSGSTADTVNWYINDQDILTTTNTLGSTVTLYFAQQNLQTLIPGVQVRLANWVIGYTKLVTLIAATNSSITFTDPGDLPSISGMNILLSVPTTVTDSQTTTYIDSSNKIFDIPTSSTLVRSSRISKLVAGPSIGISANLQKQITALKADNNQKSSTYNTATQISVVNKAIFGKKIPRAYTTSTLNLVTTDVQISVISRTGSTADTVSWYINDQDILTIIPLGSALVTLYFARPADNVIINSSIIKIINSNIGYEKQVSVISKTENSVTFADPGDLPSISNMFIIGTTSQYVVNYSTVAYLDSSTEIFYAPTSGNTSVRPVKQQLLAETVRIQTPGKARNISKLIAGTNITPLANLQKQFAVLKADNNQRTSAYSTTTQIPLVARAIFGKRSTRAYTTATTRTVISDIAIPITGITGSTADIVSWYINDQDILTVIPLGSALVTLYFAKSSYAITGTIKLTNTNIGYSKQISVISSTDGSITFINPGDLPSISGMYIVISTTQSVIDYATYAYLDSGTQMFDAPRASKLSTVTQLKSDLARVQTVGKTAVINRLLGKTAPGTSGNLQKQFAIIKGDNNQRTATYSTTTQISVVNKVTFGGRIPKAYTISTSTTIYIDTPWPITGRSGSTADTVNWYIYDQDILNTSQFQGSTVTLYFAQQTLQNFTAGSQVRLISWVSGYTKQVILTSATEASITFTDPGDLPSISGLSILLTIPQTIIDNISITRFENNNELVNAPKSGNLSKSSIILKSDSTATKASGVLNKTSVKLISSPSIANRPGKVASAIVVRSDNNQRSSTYNTATQISVVNKAIFGKSSTRAYVTATIRTVTTDIQTAVISRIESTADTVSWYINDQDILTIIPTGSTLVTLYFATAQLGNNIRITNVNIGYNKSISIVNITNSSITFTDPGDLPSISGMYIVSSTTQNIVDYVTYSYVDSSSQLFDVPKISKLSAVTQLKSELARIQTPGRVTRVNKLIGKTAPGTSGNLQKQFAIIKGDNNQRTATYSTTTQISVVNKVTFGGRIPRAYTTSTTKIVYIDTPWPVTGRSGSTADTVNWYIYDQDILNTAQFQGAEVTLYFAQQNLQTLSPGLQIRLLSWTVGYTKLVTLIAATNSSITFTDPGDLPSISGLNILLSVPQTIIDNISVTQFESSNELVNTPKIGNLAKSLIVLRAESTATKMSGLINKPIVSLRGGPPSIPALGKVKSVIVLRPDNNQRSSLYTTATGITLINKAIFGKSSTRAYTTATTRTVTTDIQTAVISRTGSTADTVSWYINDQDILTVIPEGSALVTFYFATAQLGSNIRIINPNIGYARSIAVISTTLNSVTFTDPGDLPSISGMYIVSSITQTILDYATYTYLDSGTQMFDVPRVSKLSRAISVKADTAQIRTVGKAKTISKLTAGTSVGIPFNLQKQLTVLKADANQRSTLYTTSTGITLVNKAKFGTYIPRPYTSSVTRTVYVDTPWPITGRDGSTADIVNWYIYDQDILNTSQSQGATVTLYFAQQNLQTLSAGLQIRLISWTIGYTRLVTLIAATNSSITFADPGDLPSISGLSILLSVPSTITDFQTTVALESGSEMFSTPKSSNLVKSSLTVRAVPTVFQTSATVSKNLVKLASAVNVSGLAKLTRATLVKGIPFTASTVTNIPLVNKAIFGKRVPQAYTSATTRTIYTDIQISIIGITGSTADTVSWYINDQDILTVIPVGSALVTLYFAKQNQNYFSVGSQVRVFNSNIGYNQLVTLTSFTDGSITFVNPGDLPSISGMYVVVTQSQNVIDYITVSNLDYSTSIFSIPTVNSLIKSQIQIRSPRTISAAYTLTNTANRLESTVNATTFVYTQTSVSTTLAPTTARERLYYAQVAPGRYGKIITYNGSSVAPGGILSTTTNRLESTVNATTFVYTQTSVTTTLAPTNARERLYYAQIAAGKYGVTVTYNGRSIAPGGILSTTTNRLESTVNATTFVYTQTSVTTTLAPTTARERLYYAQIAAGKYGVTVTYNGRFLSGGLNVPATDAFQQRTKDNRFYGIAPIEVNRNLEFFNDTNLTGEISFPIKFQTTNVLTTSNSIEAYIYDYDILTYSTYQSPSRKFVLSYNSVTVPSTTSTNIKYIPFAVGSTVKIYSKKLGYLNTFTVSESNYDTVTVSNISSIPLLGDTDDLTITGLPSVYPIASVSTTRAPTTARENLYYFNISPGLRSGKNLTVGEVSRIPNAAKLTSSLVVKALPNNLSASVTNRIAIKLKSDTTSLTPSKLTQATRLQSDRSSVRSSNLELIYFVDYFSSSTVTTSTFVVPTASIQINRDPQNSREALYYAQMGPGVRNRGITLTAFGKQTVDVSSKLPVNTLNKNISPLKADSAKIIIGKTSIPSMLVGRPSLEKSGNLQKSIQILKADSSYPTKSYTAIDTTSTVYDSYSLPVISRSGYTADTVNWYINDQDVLTVSSAGSGPVTLYFAPSQYSLDNSAVFLIQSTIGYSKQISSYTYTNSSITFDDPGDLPNVSGMIISWSRPRTVTSTTVTGIDNSKTPLVNKAIFGKKLPQARVAAVNKIIYVDTFLPILNASRAVATANTVDWYIEDRDILTTTNLSDNLVTLIFARHATQNFSIGNQIKLVDLMLSYTKQVTVISCTETSVTFTDPGDLIISSSLNILLSLPKTVTDFQTTTYLDSSTEIFESPTSSNLVKSSIKLRSDTAKLQTTPGKSLFKVVDGPPLIPTPGKVTSAIVLRPDSSYRSPTYTSTSTTSVVYDSYSVAVIGSDLSTANTVAWYIDDRDVLTVVPTVSSLVTLYFTPGQNSVVGASLQIIQTNIGYSRTITDFSYTNSSITFINPGDLPSTTGMTINWTRSRTTIAAAAIGQDINKIPLVTKALFGKKLPQPRVSSVIRTINVDIALPVISRSGPTADTVNWYINDQDILTTTSSNSGSITLYFVAQTVQTFTAGGQVRLANYSVGYIKQLTIISATNSSITINDPGDLPSSLNILISTPQYISDFVTSTYLDNSTEIFESPISSNLVKSSIKLRPDAAKLQTIPGKVPLKVTDGPPDISRSLANLQKPLIQLRPDSSYSSPTYTSTSTTSVVYDNYSVAVIGSNLSTADTVGWYINDRDVLTVTPVGTSLITLYFAPGSDSVAGASLQIIQSNIGYSRTITGFTYTGSSITFPNPGDLPSTAGMTINWIRSRTTVTATAIGQNLNKIPLVSKAIFGKKLPQARVSSVIKTIYVDAPITVTAINRPRSTADTVNWYINDNDILTTGAITGSLITLFFDRQNLQIFSAGDTIRLADYSLNYIKQVTLVSTTPISVTFTDPGDLISSSNNLKIIVSSTQTVTDFQTTTYLDSSTEIFESPISSNLVKSSIKLRPDTAKLQTIPGKVPLKVVDGPPLIPTPGKVTSTVILRPDSSYSSPSYTSTSTTSVIYDSYYAVVTGSSETGVTTDAVSWYIDDKDILTVVPTGSKALTLFFDPIQDPLFGVTVTVSHGPTNYYRVITNFTSTRSSITFPNPGDIFSTSGMILTWTKPRTTITAAAIGQNLNKIPLVNKVIFGKKLPQARVSSINRTIYVDTPIPVIGRSGSTADIVNWYIYDQDILNTLSSADTTVTLYLAKQNIQTFTAGSQVRLANYLIGYVRQVTVISATDNAITFNDPGDLPSISGLNIIVSVEKTITDFQTATYLENTTEIFESPTSSNLVKSSIKLRPDAAKLQTIPGKVPLKVVDGPPDISRSLANLQKSLIQLRPDSSYSSPTYTSTSTTSVTYDNYSVAVTGSDVSTANTVAWYIEDRDILTVFPRGSSLITLYFAPGPDSVAGAVIQLVQNAIGYIRTITSFTYTGSSITFLDPGDLPSTSGMTINWSRPKTTVTATAIGQNLNKIPLVSKAIFGKKLPQPRTVAVTSTIYVDNPIPVLTVNRPKSTANTVAWYIEDRDILTTSSAADSTVTLIFARQTLKKFTVGEQIRLADYALNYVKQVTVIATTDTSVTFTDPGDLVTTNSLNILVSVAQTVTDSQTTTYLDSSIEIFDTPKISNLAYKQLVQLRAEPAVFKDLGKVKIPLKLIPTGEISTTAKLLTFAILKADRNKLAIENLSTTGSKAMYKLTDGASIKLALGRGQIIKLHTGNFKLGSVGIQDPAAQKKEPIQFWN